MNYKVIFNIKLKKKEMCKIQKYAKNIQGLKEYKRNRTACNHKNFILFCSYF